MPITLSIKNTPDDVVARLKERAARHHRSLQGELMSIIEEAVRSPRARTARDILAEVRRLGVSARAESAALVREDRDGR